MTKHNSPLSKALSVLLFVVFLMLSFISDAQKMSASKSKDFQFSVSQPYRVIDAAEKDYFHKGESIIAVKQSGKKVTIQKFGKARLNQISVHEYPDMPDGYSYEGFVETNEKLYLFFSVWDKPNKHEQLFCREIDCEKGEFVGKDKLMLTINGKITGTPTGSMTYGIGYAIGSVSKFYFHNCLDSSKFMIQYKNAPETKDDAKNFDKVGLFVFDYNLNKLWGKEVKMPYTEKKMDILDYALDSNGNVYILSKIFNTNSTKEKGKGGKVNYHMEIFQMSESFVDLKVTPINLGEKLFVSSILMYETVSQNMICVGYYNDGENINTVGGLFTFKIKNGTEISDIKVIDIPTEVITQYMSEKSKAKIENREAKDDDVEAGLMYLLMKKLVVNRDGSFIVIGEQTYSTTYYNGKTSVTTNYCENMLVTKIDPSGKVAWMQNLPKKQAGPKPKGGMSFKYMNYGEFNYLVYMDNFENLALPINRPPGTYRDGARGYLTSYKINEKTGDVSKVALFDTKDVNGIEVFQFDTDRIFSIDDSEFLVELYKKGKEDVMIRVELGESKN